MRSLLVLVFLLTVVPSAHAQQRPGQLLVYSETGGAALNVVSANAEFALTRSLGVRAGYGSSLGVWSGYVGMAHLYSSSGRWELGAGAGAFRDDEKGESEGVWPTAYVGFRRVPARGLVFRLGAAVMLSDDGVFGLPGASLGYAF
jgi:hypothetical protein